MKRVRNIVLLLLAGFSLGVVFSIGWFGYQWKKQVAIANGPLRHSFTQMDDLALAAMTYAATHGGLLPKTLPELLAARPGSSPFQAISPLASDQTVPSYEMVAPAEPLSQVSDLSHTPMIRSVTLKGGGRIVAFCDGHVELVSE